MERDDELINLEDHWNAPWQLPSTAQKTSILIDGLSKLPLVVTVDIVPYSSLQ